MTSVVALDVSRRQITQILGKLCKASDITQENIHDRLATLKDHYEFQSSMDCLNTWRNRHVSRHPCRVSTADEWHNVP